MKSRGTIQQPMNLLKKVVILQAGGALFAILLLFSSLMVSSQGKRVQQNHALATSVRAAGVTNQSQAQPVHVEVPYEPPSVIKAVYATSNTALSPERFGKLVNLIKTTELNAMVINVNDAKTNLLDDPRWPEVVATLNGLGLHTIARIIVFQNEPLVAAHPEWAVKTAGGAIWRDGGGHRWLDPSNRDAWQHVLTLSEQAAMLGFRELNYDYIRFPSDGAAARYPLYTPDVSKAKVINDFASFLHDRLKQKYPTVMLSVDIFAHSILVNDDTNIGQRFIDIVDYFDVVAPMTYTSHYRSCNFGFANPAAHPYEVVYNTLALAKQKLQEADKSHVIIRPWLQDFNLGAVYTAAMVKQQIKATSDAGFMNGWMLWNPSNRYTRGTLSSETEKATTP